MMSTTEAMLTRRQASLPDMVDLLRQQHDARLDVVAPARDLRAVGGQLEVTGVGEPRLTMDGVTPAAQRFRITGTCDEGIAEKLEIPLPYLRRTREKDPGLYDHNVNTWLADQPDRRFLVRALRSTAEHGGIARALLSDKYRITDNLDVLLSVLAGVRASGLPVQVTQCDLTERRMYVKLRCEAVAVHAPALLANYQSPFNGRRGADNPVVFAGFLVSNSETGHGSFSITPQLTVQICDNGMTITRDALREVHLGARLDRGIVRWQHDTQDTQLELVSKQARDAVSTFLDRGYVQAKLHEIQTEAGVRVDDVEATLQHVGKQLRFTQEQQKTILEHFIDGGDRTAGGVLHAVTSTAQTIADADEAYDLERTGLAALSLAAAFQH